MITISRVQLPDGSYKDLHFPEEIRKIIDGRNLLALPAMIDPHVHFRTPGFEHKENWETAARAALKGGVTTVFDMPNTNPATITVSRLKAKKALIAEQLKKANIPLRFDLFFGADKHHFDELCKVGKDAVGLKIFMGASTGDLLMDDDSSLHAAFTLASRFNLTIAVHAEDEKIIQENQEYYKNRKDFYVHAEIRSPEAAASAVEKAIILSQLYQTRLYILHVSSKLEIDLIRAAKQKRIPVYAETCPHYLFLCDQDYERLNGLAKMNPALRTKEDRDCLWKALNDGVIDTIGSDHAPHTLEEKQQAYACCPAGVPGIETTLPLLYTAVKEKKLSLKRLVDLTSENPRKLFNLPKHEDWVFIDPETVKPVRNEQLCTKAQWSPYVGMELCGWPKYVSLKSKLYDLEKL